MKTRKTIALVLASLGVMTTMSSCIISQAVGVFVRKEHPGTLPSVIRDAQGRPVNPKWLNVDHDSLPAPSSLTGEVDFATDGIPYGMTSEYSYVVVSPYKPNNLLSYKGFQGGDKVWDPYTRKAFYIPRTHTIN